MGGAVNLRAGTRADLAAINEVVTAAVMGWPLPDRVKRLALAGYRYGEDDFAVMQFLVAAIPSATSALDGVAAWEPADPRDVPGGVAGAWLLHGLYVRPAAQRRGIGTALLEALLAGARAAGVPGLLVKANRHAADYFRARGLQALAVVDPQRDYPYRYWAALA